MARTPSLIIRNLLFTIVVPGVLLADDCPVRYRSIKGAYGAAKAIGRADP